MTYGMMTAADRLECADLAARAFCDYEYFTNYVPDGKKRLTFLRCMLEIETRINGDKALFFTARDGDRLSALAMLCPPGYVKPSSWEYMRAGFWKCFIKGGLREVAAWNDMESEALGPCRALPGAWYLNMLTVEPELQGFGVGRGMLNDCVIPYAGSRGGGTLCLFTNSAANREFYKKNGFEEFDSRTFAYRGKDMGSWSFRLDL